jgi:ribonuclease P protein component
LRRKWQFDQLYSRGQRLGNSFFGLTLKPNDLDSPRLGLAVASKTFGGSVGRNRMRRLVRESFRLHQRELPAVDIVVSVRATARAAQPQELRASLASLWDRVRSRCDTLPSV